MAVATKKKPIKNPMTTDNGDGREHMAGRLATPPASTSPDIFSKPHKAFSIIKLNNGENLWCLVTYTLEGGKIVKEERGVEDLREILIAKIPDMIGGLL